jgi:AcrR family transcriptional regulator
VSDDVKTRILAAATRHFSAAGYAATSIQRVASDAGVTRPTLVYHFGSKEGLRDAVIDQLLGHWKDTIPAILTAATSRGDRFQAALDVFLRFFAEEPHRARLLVREMLDRPEAMRELFRTHLQPFTALLTDALRAGRAKGSYPADLDPEAYILHVLTAALGTLAVGAATEAVLVEPPTEARRLDELVRIARTALFTSPPPSQET